MINIIKKIRTGAKVAGLTTIISISLTSKPNSKHETCAPQVLAQNSIQSNYQYPELAFVDFEKKDFYWLVPLIAAAVGVVIGCEYKKRKCPKCKRAWGLKYTGNTENTVGKRWSWLFKFYYDEYQCKYCGYEEWKPSNKE